MLKRRLHKRLSLLLSKCHNVGNHMPRLKLFYFSPPFHSVDQNCMYLCNVCRIIYVCALFLIRAIGLGLEVMLFSGAEPFKHFQ